jgi:hypothetical protein
MYWFSYARLNARLQTQGIDVAHIRNKEMEIKQGKLCTSPSKLINKCKYNQKIVLKFHHDLCPFLTFKSQIKQFIIIAHTRELIWQQNTQSRPLQL